jgi:hypothetical protein
VAAVQQPAASQSEAEKGGRMTVARLEPAATDLAEISPATLRFERGTRDGVVDRYPLGRLFDGDPATFVQTAAGDREIDFIAELPENRTANITGIEYQHPPSGGDTVASQIDVMVLPEGDGGGREVKTFAIAPEKGPQRFALPATRGKGVWLRIAAPEVAGDVLLGDIRLLTAGQ